MFENAEAAKYVLNMFLDLNGQMNEAIGVVEQKVSSEELTVFKRAVGDVMYEVFSQVIEPICRKHPSLRPPGMEE